MRLVIAAVLMAVSSAYTAELDGIWLESRLTARPDLKAAPYVKLADGSALTVIDTAAYMTRDKGKTWSDPIPVIKDTEKFKVSNERALVRTPQGVIVLAFMNLKEQKWGWDDKANDALPGATLPVYIMRSMDEGRTWEPPRQIQDGYCGAVRQAIVTRSGKVIVTAQKLVYNPARHVTITYSSDDNGKTWQASNVIDLGGRGHHDGVIEPTFVELKDGRIWMLLRTNLDAFWEAISDDGGRYWRTIRRSNIDASSAPGYVTRLASGRLIMAWNRLWPEGKRTYDTRAGSFSERPTSMMREELSIAFSQDDGKTWSAPVVIARKPKTWLSYPWIFEPSPGELWLTSMQGGLRTAFLEADFVK